MTKIRRYTIPSAAVLAVAAGLGLATAPAQAAAVVTYNSCASTSFCTLTELLAGGSISVDEDGNGTIEKTFDNWTNYSFFKNPMTIPVTDPKSNIQVSATGTYIPGVSGSATLNYTVLNNALTLAPSVLNVTWFAGISFDFDVTSAGYVPMVERKDALTSASTAGTTSNMAMFNATSIMGNQTATPTSPVTDIMPFPETTTYTAMNNLTLSARRTGTIMAPVPGTASVTSFSQTFTQVVIPEPGTVAGLLVAGGLGLAMKRRQKDS